MLLLLRKPGKTSYCVLLKDFGFSSLKKFVGDARGSLVLAEAETCLLQRAPGAGSTTSSPPLAGGAAGEGFHLQLERGIARACGRGDQKPPLFKGWAQSACGKVCVARLSARTWLNVGTGLVLLWLLLPSDANFCSVRSRLFLLGRAGAPHEKELFSPAPTSVLPCRNFLLHLLARVVFPLSLFLGVQKVKRGGRLALCLGGAHSNNREGKQATEAPCLGWGFQIAHTLVRRGQIGEMWGCSFEVAGALPGSQSRKCRLLLLFSFYDCHVLGD